METVHVKGFSDFLTLLLRTSHPIHQYIYRGVPDEAFTLRPAIGRRSWIRDGDFDQFRFMNSEYNLLEEFKRRTPLMLSTYPTSDVDWLCLGRHYGLATRLLDWTLNPLIALFFAAYPDSSADFVVYSYWFSHWFGRSLDSKSLEEIQKADESLPLYPKLADERFVRQSAVLLVCHRPWEDFQSPLPQNLTKYIFPAKARNEIRFRLNVFGVTPSSVLPGLDGLCHQINDEILFREKFTFRGYVSKKDRASFQVLRDAMAQERARRGHIPKKRIGNHRAKK